MCAVCDEGQLIVEGWPEGYQPQLVNLPRHGLKHFGIRESRWPVLHLGQKFSREPGPHASTLIEGCPHEWSDAHWWKFYDDWATEDVLSWLNCPGCEARLRALLEG